MLPVSLKRVSWLLSSVSPWTTTPHFRGCQPIATTPHRAEGLETSIVRPQSLWHPVLPRVGRAILLGSISSSVNHLTQRGFDIERVVSLSSRRGPEFDCLPGETPSSPSVSRLSQSSLRSRRQRHRRCVAPTSPGEQRLRKAPDQPLRNEPSHDRYRVSPFGWWRSS